MKIDETLTPASLQPAIERLWQLSAEKIESIDEAYPVGHGSPVFTVDGRYTARGWTEWTQGFQFGSALLQYEATGEERFLTLGRHRTVQAMAPHLTHIGVHDHGFNNVSTYGNLWRLMNEERLPENLWERHLYELALKVSGAVQASRWAHTADGTGYIYSFNGPQSLFIDTIRSCRSLALAHLLGHVLMTERDVAVSLLDRLIEHIRSTAHWNIFYGHGRDAYDTRGRVAHESIFNTADGHYRCPSSQQGYSAFTTWTRGLAWAMLGFAEQLEYLRSVQDHELALHGGRENVEACLLEAAMATCDFYLAHTPADGIPYWDTGAPGLQRIPDLLDRPADPYNPHEPVDSSAAAIAAQGFLRLGHHLGQTTSAPTQGSRYWQAGLTICSTLFQEPYLCSEPRHQGLILHSVYHRPNGWDSTPPGSTVPRGESSMWGDYHAREVALYLQRMARSLPYHTFFGAPQH